MRFFCTYCDQGYAARLLCLFRSLVRHGESLRLFVVCFDDVTYRIVAAENSPSIVPIALAELLDADPEYAAVRSQRSPVEFFFTTTPVVVRHCLKRDPQAADMTYLDSDLYFFGRANDVWREQGDGSVGIVPHRFPPHLASRLVYGTYNVSWVSFRRDAAASRALDWWRERCLEWCRDEPDNGRFADQGYLNEFPTRFQGVRVLDDPGINAAPWNVHHASIAREHGHVTIDGRPLLFYHFQGIRELEPGLFEPGLEQYGATLRPALRDLVYRPYLEQLLAEQSCLKRRFGIEPRIQNQRLNAGTSLRDRWERAKVRYLLPYYGRLRGQLLHIPSPTETPPA